MDSEGNTIDFMLSPYRDLTAAKHFLQLALWQTGQIRPRVINVDGHPACSLSDLRDSGELSSRCHCRLSPYLNNILEQDHRFIKKRIAASLWFRSVDGALNTIAGYESMNMIRKGQGSVASKRRHCRTDELYSAALWNRCMIQTEFTDFVRSGAVICNTSEFPNAWIKTKIKLRQFQLRGRAKVTMETLWAVLVYNIQQWIRLRWRVALQKVVAG